MRFWAIDSLVYLEFQKDHKSVYDKKIMIYFQKRNIGLYHLHQYWIYDVVAQKKRSLIAAMLSIRRKMQEIWEHLADNSIKYDSVKIQRQQVYVEQVMCLEIWSISLRQEWLIEVHLSELMINGCKNYLWLCWVW